MSKRVLIIDDDPSIRKLYARTIRAEDREVTAVASGAEAMEILSQHGADLILLDLNMPGMNGAAALEMIREAYRTIPIFIITGFLDVFLERLKVLRQAGIQFEVLNKPVEKEHLRAAVSSVLDGPVEVPQA
jgi:CheY-like chemotaxis protein